MCGPVVGERSPWLWARFAVVLCFPSFYSNLIYAHTLALFLNNLQLLNFLEHGSHLNGMVSVLLSFRNLMAYWGWGGGEGDVCIGGEERKI